MKRGLLPLLIVALAGIGGGAGFLLGGYFYANPPAPPGITQIDRGEVVPDIAWHDGNGRERRLSEWRGNLVLINYWASWCAPCIQEMPMLDRYAQTHADSGLVVLGVAEDDPEAVVEFVRQHPVAYPILTSKTALGGSSLQLGNSRGVLPFTALIAPDGRLLDHHTGVLDPAGLDIWLAAHRPTR